MPNAKVLSEKQAIVAALTELRDVPAGELLDRRYAKFTAMGRFT